MKKNLIFLAIGIVLIVGVFMVLTRIPRTSTFSPFPLQESTAEYSIFKSQNSYSLTYKRGGDDLALLIGSTPVDLDQFVGKRVKVTGSFIESKPYCKGDCSSIGTSIRPVVKIDTIVLAE